MKRLLSLLSLGALVSLPLAGQVHTSEQLNRGFTVIATRGGNILSWRTLPNDVAEGISFRVLQYKADGTYTAKEVAGGSASCIVDATKHPSYGFEVYQNGVLLPEYSVEGITAETSLRQIHMERPAGGSTSTGSYTYTPNDCSVGDVDGDGEYEIIVKWDPSNSQDNSKSDYKTGNTIFDCYEITGPNVGQHLWRIDLGVNVRAGAHYSPFLVYDFDGDGKAEFVVKTAPGSKDATGTFVSKAGKTEDISSLNNNTTDYRNSGGHILKGEEFLTIFSGETGAALQTIWYWPNMARQAAKSSASTSYSQGSWGDTYGNRGHRYNACVAYLDGLDQLPSIVMQRGYYTQSYFWAVDWDGQNLSTRWLHQGTAAKQWSVIDAEGQQLLSGSNASSYGQGVHGISVADVDGDGCDEIIMGSATIDHDGSLLCSTGFGHGDAIHVGKFIPGREGYQIFMPHEEKSANYGDDLHDAATGEVLYRGTTSSDNGRGLACDMFYKYNSATGLDEWRGWEFWSGAEGTPLNAVTHEAIGKKPDTNFRVYWDGDLYDESLDGRFSTSTNSCSPRIISWNGTANATTELSSLGGQPQACNYTKATPCLVADLYGDWREEIVMWDASDAATLDIYTTNTTTKFPVPCLMTDHVYRMGVAWQNSSYNQPPHLGYYLADAFNSRYELAEGALTDTVEVGQPYQVVIRTANVKSCTVNNTTLPEGISYSFDPEAQTLTVSGTPTQTGDDTRVFSLVGYNTSKVTLRLVVVPTAGIDAVNQDAPADAARYDLMGRRTQRHSSGVSISNGKAILTKQPSNI